MLYYSVSLVVGLFHVSCEQNFPKCFSCLRVTVEHLILHVDFFSLQLRQAKNWLGLPRIIFCCGIWSRDFRVILYPWFLKHIYIDMAKVVTCGYMYSANHIHTL